MLPAPTTIATSTPCCCTAATWRATAATRSGSVPNSSVPISASPESFSRIRLKAGAGAIDAAAYPLAFTTSVSGLLANREAGEAADDDVLAGRRGELVAQLLHGLAVELGVVHLLLEQDDRLIPRVELAGDDFLAHVLGLVGGFLLVDLRLGVARVGGDVVAADVLDARRRGDLHRDVACELDEVVVVRDEVGVAVDLDQHADARAGVDVGLHGALGRDALAEILDLLALLQAQDLDGLVHIAAGLGERFLAVHHACARALAQRLDVFRGNLDGAHCGCASFAGSSACGLLSSGVSAGASAAGASASLSLAVSGGADCSFAG